MSTGSELYDLLAKTNATLNPNNTITLRFNDGSSYTTGVIKDGPELSPADKAMEEAKEASATSQAAMEEAGTAATAAGNAEQSASAAAASATNAENFASAAQQSASTAASSATNAETSASNAATSAGNAATSAQAAATSADAAESEAQTAATEASEAKTQANEAKTQAGEAKTQASRATSYANGALNSLSTTQDIIGVLSWVEESIKYVWDYPPTVEDKEYDPSKQYYTVIGKRVIGPIETDYDKYYVLNSESEPASKTGNIVTFDSDLDNFPLKSLTATINPKQDLHGYDKPWVGGAGKNLFYNTYSVTSAGVNYTVGNDASEIVVKGTSTAQSDAWLWSNNANRPFYLPSGEYTISVSGLQGDMRLIYSGAGNNGVQYYELKLADGNTKRTFTVTDGTKPFNYFVLRASAGQTFDTTVKVQIEKGSTATDYEPYSNICPISGWDDVKTYVSPTISAEEGTTYTTDLPETVYGGSLDVVNGVLNIKPYYASYNGETLSGEWISDRDVYSEGITPTIGAQVVNIGATGTNVQLTPKQATTLLGTNNVWADSGDVTVEYWDGPVGYVTPTSSFDPTETYYTVKGSPVKIDESKQEEHGKGLYYVHDLTNAKEAMADFIKARLALTDKGLYVVGGDTENEGYKILLASDGMTVYDAQGNAVSKFGENIEFSSTRAQYIGGETAYIVFNPEDGTINAGGEGFRFNNNMTLSDMLAEVGKVGGLEDDTNGLLQKTSSISYKNGELILSDSKSAFAVKITNTKLSFMQGEQEVAYITGNQLHIPYTVVLNAMDVGPWRWRKQDNGNLTLQYIG